MITPTAWALHDSTSFNPEQVQVQATSIGVPVGTVIVWTKEEVPEGWLECNGQVVNADLYPDLADLMPIAPDYRDKFLQGKNGQEVGTNIEAGLPNATGKIITVSYPHKDQVNESLYDKYNRPDGDHAIYITHETAGPGYTLNNVWYPSSTFNLRLDLSKDNPIYGKSETVQPPAVVVKYIIKAE